MNTSGLMNCIVALLALSIILGVTGCASVQSAPPGLRTERRSAGGVHVQSIRLATTDKGLLVSGSVSRTIGYASSPRRHLDIEIVAEEGAVPARTATNFIPNPIRHDPRLHPASYYAVTIPQLPPPDSTVRVSVHLTTLRECPSYQAL